MSLEDWLAAIPAVVAAWVVVRADVRRRRISANPIVAVLATAVAAMAVLEAAGRFVPGNLQDLLSDWPAFAWFPALIAGAAVVLLLARFYKLSPLVALDIAAPAAAISYAANCIAWFFVRTSGHPSDIVPAPRFASAAVWEFVAALLTFWVLWTEGRRAMQWQRPNGIVAAEFGILMGALLFAMESLRAPLHWRTLDLSQWASLALFAVGIALLALVLRRYFSTREEHRILDDVTRRGDTVQPEYTPPTPECPNPGRWRMYDTMTAEIEVLDFLKSLVTTIKPDLIVETGTFSAMSTIAMAEGLRQNGFGRIITCELDPRVFANGAERIAASGLADWIEHRNESSLEMKVDGPIDLLFCDGDPELRHEEVRRFLPRMSPDGLILVHDGGTHYNPIRERVLQIEAESLISLVMLPTPRGLIIAQRRRAAPG